MALDLKRQGVNLKERLRICSLFDGIGTVLAAAAALIKAGYLHDVAVLAFRNLHRRTCSQVGLCAPVFVGAHTCVVPASRCVSAHAPRGGTRAKSGVEASLPFRRSAATKGVRKHTPAKIKCSHRRGCVRAHLKSSVASHSFRVAP
jgi:hypothetical protein